MTQGPAPSGPRVASEIVGREDEIAAVAAFLAGRIDRGAALVVEGEAGIGKTTIVRAALELAPSVRIMSARPTEGEMELPYAALGDLLAKVRSGSLRRLAGPQKAAIEVARGREGSGVTVDENALTRGLLELLRPAAAGGLLIVVDDVQWLDRPTTAALTFVLRRLEDSPIRVLVSVRRTGRSRVEAPLGLDGWQNMHRLTVGALSATELGTLVRHRLGETFPSPRLKALRNASGGNPMFALELARQGYPARVGSAADSLSHALRERLRVLAPMTRLTLACAAAALRPSPDALRQAGVERAALHAALDTGILVLDGERLTFSHPLLGVAAYDLLLPEERRALHVRLAAASDDLVERGHHVSRSADIHDDDAAAMLDHAADQASNLGDHAGAAAFLLRAAELCVHPDGDAARTRELRAAVELELAGDMVGSIAISRRLVERLPAGPPRARARQILLACSGGEDLEWQLDQFSLALDDAAGDDALQADIYLAMAETAAGLSRLEDTVELAKKAFDLANAAGSATSATGALAQLGFVQCMLGEGVTEAARTALSRWHEDDVWLTAYSPRLSLGCVYLYTGSFSEAEVLGVQELLSAQEHGIEPLEAMVRGLLAETQMRAGRWAEALVNGRLAVEQATHAAHDQIITGVSYAPTMVQALLGETAGARDAAEPLLAGAEARNDFWFGNYFRGVLGLVALTDDDPPAAVEVLQPAWRRMLERGLGELSIFPVAQVLGEALVAVGRVDEALDVAVQLRDSPAAVRPWCRAMASRITALVESARGHHDDALAHLTAALEAHEEMSEPFEHARTLHLGGRIQRSARHWGAARASFVEALERFDALGAARWAEKASADIARLPGRRPSDSHGLTPREREVAQLVAGGLANKEVAAKLFLSVSTVETILSRVYAKLGVRSRTRLAGVLVASEGVPPSDSGRSSPIEGDLRRT